MGDKAIISEILEASHLTDTYQHLTAQNLIGEIVGKKDGQPEPIRYEGIEGEKPEEGGKVDFGATLDRRDEVLSDDEMSDGDQSGLFPLLGVAADTFTVDQAVDALGFGKFQIKLSLLTGLAWIVFSGMMLSSTMWGNICDKYGRRVGLIMSAGMTFYFGLLSSFSPTFLWLLILRGLTGFGIGGVPQSVTLYAEFLPSAHRAKCVVLIEAFWAIGACFEVVLALLVMESLGWPWLLALSAMPLLVFCICCYWLPESARFQVASGQLDSAYATLERIAAENGKPMLLGKLVETSAEDQKRGQITDLFMPELKITTILLWFIWCANAFSYYGIVLFTTEIFESGDECHGGPPDVLKGLSVKDPVCPLECHKLTHKDYWDLLWTTLAEFPGLLITAFIIEAIGRKKTMALEFAVYSFFVFLLFLCLNRTMITVFIFVARAFISGAFQAAYVYTPEVYPTTMRAIGLGACSGLARLGAIVTPFVAQVAIDWSVNVPVGIYGVVTVLAMIAALILPIETKGRVMQDTH